MAPEGYKETARQHPRAVPVISETHVLPGSETCAAEVKPIPETVSRKQENEKSPKTLTQTSLFQPLKHQVQRDQTLWRKVEQHHL